MLIPHPSVLNPQHFSIASAPHHMPEGEFVWVSGPSNRSPPVSAAEMLGSELLSLPPDPFFFFFLSWKPGSFPSSPCPNAAPPSVAVQRQVRPPDTWPLGTAPAADGLLHRSAPVHEATSPHLLRVVSKPSSVLRGRVPCLVPPPGLPIRRDCLGHALLHRFTGAFPPQGCTASTKNASTQPG